MLAAGDRGLRCRVAVASTFGAALELARVGAIGLGQEGAFGTLVVGPATTAP
jgi:chromatin segregation and condensation protein Rec8/ScpA/Scc1 (kleisin family)